MNGALQVSIALLKDKAELSREDRFMLEKHAQDIFRMLIGSIVEIDAVASVGPERAAKTRRLLEEYIETKTLLERD
jgi:hypothetical protein